MASAALRFLADESCDASVVHALREEGYDVFALSDVMRRSVDREVIDRSAREGRILLTEDKDFGWLVFVAQADSAGVILMRFPERARHGMAAAMVQVIRSYGDALSRAFIVVQPGLVRIRRRVLPA